MATRWRKNQQQADTGLTLLELVICVAVLAVLGMLALPNLGTQLERQRLRNAAQTLAGDITEARFLAAQRGQAVHVQAQDGPTWCWGVSMSSGCDCNTVQACRIHAVPAASHNGIRLLNPMALQLEPTGVVQSTASATFESPHGDRLRVDVSPQGRARICALSGAWPQLPAC
jgi:type IV fimbrial biogenesis protein FimT